MSGDMPDAIICAKFYVKQLRGLGYTEGQILVSAIEMAGHPYNSAALYRAAYTHRAQRRAVVARGQGILPPSLSPP